MTDIIEQADIIARGEVALENETRLSIYERSVIRDLVAELKATRAENEKLKDLIWVLQGGGV